jgi:hypothetical protein
MEEEEITLWIIVAFIAGLFLVSLCASSFRSRHRQSRLAAAEGEPRHDGKRRSMNLLAVLLALVIVADHVKGPLFHDLAYCLNDGGAQTTRMCTGRVPP